jgi:hypothetical protein
MSLRRTVSVGNMWVIYLISEFALRLLCFFSYDISSQGFKTCAKNLPAMYRNIIWP